MFPRRDRMYVMSLKKKIEKKAQLLQHISLRVEPSGRYLSYIKSHSESVHKTWRG